MGCHVKVSKGPTVGSGDLEWFKMSYQNIIHEAVQSSFNVGTRCGIEIYRSRSSEKLISER